MNKNYEHFQLSQKIILYRPSDKKFLLVKDAFEDSEYHQKYGPWELPGGRVDTGENVEAALFREIKEELGEEIEFDLKGAVAGCHMKLDSDRNNDPYRAVFAYLTIFKGGEINISDEHSEYDWKTVEEIESGKEYKSWLKEFIRSATTHIQKEEYLTDLKRIQADFENYKKRQQESQKELGGYLIEKLVLDIIPVLDNFRAATMHVPPEQKESPWVVGIQYIEKQLEDVVKQNGVEVIEAKEGDAFDPTIHEAVSQENEPSSAEATDGQGKKEAEKHVIAKVLQNGFRLGGKVIRPAKVSVK